MIRRLALPMLLLSSAFVASSASAYPISQNNPYRSFNITGINYGSMQWERDHRGWNGYHSYNGYGVHRGFFRR
jgi:hypothetical protein